MSTRTPERTRGPRAALADPVSGASRAVLLLGITIGTALVVLALWQDARPQLPGMPAFLGLAAGVLLMWLIVMALATVAAHLVHRHHRAMAAHVGRHGKRAALAGARRAGRGYRAAYDRLTPVAAARWQARNGGQEPAEEEAAAPPDDLPAWLRAPMPDPRLSDAQRERDANGQGHICAACGHLGTQDDPLVIADGYRVHASHTADPQDGFYDPAAAPAGAPAPAAIEQNGEPRQMSTDAVPVRNRLPDHVRTHAPAGWRTLAGTASDFEPESDEALLEWMAAEVAGISTYGEALTDLYETCVEDVRLDPVAMAALHDAADAAGDFATAMAYARQKFAAHYAEVREFVSDGGVLPKDGDFITGEGDD